MTGMYVFFFRHILPRGDYFSRRFFFLFYVVSVNGSSAGRGCRRFITIYLPMYIYIRTLQVEITCPTCVRARPKCRHCLFHRCAALLCCNYRLYILYTLDGCRSRRQYGTFVV